MAPLLLPRLNTDSLDPVTEPVVIEVDALSTLVLSVSAVGCSAVVVVPPFDLHVGGSQIKLSFSEVGGCLARLDGHAGTRSRAENYECECCTSYTREMHFCYADGMPDGRYCGNF
jgi:hypothetical protein